MRTHRHLEKRFVHCREDDNAREQIEFHAENAFDVLIRVTRVVTFSSIVSIFEIEVVTILLIETNVVTRWTALHFTSANNTVALAPHREIEGDFHILLVDVID
ncbi:hypothetical protein D3C75_790810 [compost metagenome]